jgi:hypothetical protein
VDAHWLGAGVSGTLFSENTKLEVMGVVLGVSLKMGGGVFVHFVARLCLVDQLL